VSDAAEFPSFEPPSRVLMGPGPSDVHPRVLHALSRGTLGHLDPLFVEMMGEVQEMLRRAFRTKNRATFPVSGPGSAGMEACVVNLVEPGDKVIVCVNGVFGGRMKQVVERCGGEAVVVEDAWGDPVDPEKVATALKANPGARAVGFVHAETSTGARSDAAAICALAKEAGAFSIVDTVTSLGGIPVELDEWGADAVYSGSQKCLSCTPGLSPVSFSERAVARVEERKVPVQSWFLDLSLVTGYWTGGEKASRAYHHTAPVHALYGLHEALVMLHEEGLEASWERHQAAHEALVAGLAERDLEVRVPVTHRLPQLNVLPIPGDLEDGPTRRRLLDEHGLEVGGGLGDLAGQVWRVGLMGQSATIGHVELFLGALDAVRGG
jgi:alanine-glyoxylate transaminase/serine-glyoxylate transaminase/serine-pyruvate transaminase